MARFVTPLLCSCLAASAAPSLAQQATATASCAQSAGPAKAKLYVEQCLQVSPATHPPCNAANACSLIQDEIRRGCLMLGSDAPPFCQPFLPPN